MFHNGARGTLEGNHIRGGVSIDPGCRVTQRDNRNTGGHVSSKVPLKSAKGVAVSGSVVKKGTTTTTTLKETRQQHHCGTGEGAEYVKGKVALACARARANINRESQHK